MINYLAKLQNFPKLFKNSFKKIKKRAKKEKKKAKPLESSQNFQKKNRINSLFNFVVVSFDYIDAYLKKKIAIN